MSKSTVLLSGILMVFVIGLLINVYGQSSEKKPGLDDRSEWVVVASETKTGAEKGRFVMYNRYTGESYISNNNNSGWSQLNFSSTRGNTKPFGK